MYPVLMNLANGNVRWSIAAAVKSLATIQAIVNMQYWAPVSPKQVDDSSSVSLSYVSEDVDDDSRIQIANGSRRCN